MSELISLKATARPRAGKGAARQARREGNVPAVIYGDQKPPETINLEYNALWKQVLKGHFTSTAFELDVDGNKHIVLARDVQVDPVRDTPLHVDFQRVGKDGVIRVAIPVHFVHEALSPGLKRGGVLNIVRHDIEVFCPYEKIPRFFEISLEGLEIGRSIHVSALKLPEGVTPVIKNRDFTIATIAGALKGEEETTTAVATPEAAAAAAPAADAKGAAPAAGGKAPAAAGKAPPQHLASQGGSTCCEASREEVIRLWLGPAAPLRGIGRRARAFRPARRRRVGRRAPNEALRRPRQSRREIPLNRHNIGFMAVDRIAERHGFGPWRKKFQGLVSEGTIGGERVTLLKPETYMNESGRSVGEAQRFLKIPLSDIYVFHDELDLAPGKVKVKAGGGNAGHNGLRSISAHIENDYKRVRLGIGHPGSKDAVDLSRAERFREIGPRMGQRHCSTPSPTRHPTLPKAMMPGS